MGNTVKPVPEGMGGLTPHLVIKGAADAIDFYIRAFGATEICRMACPQSGGVMHAELKIGNATLMLADENAELRCA